MQEEKFEKYGFIWFGDKEIFEFTDAQIEAVVRTYYEQGYTVLITFSGTHFRWSFYKWWDDINAYLTRFCKICHRYSIQVVEHHSCHLHYAADNPEDMEEIHHRNRMRGLRPQKWEGFEAFVSGDPVIEGVVISSMRAVDGATDKPIRSGYMAYPMCFNNPDFRRIYFEYLENLYKTGIDGIMTDDVQYMMEGTCTCEHCRKLFYEETGYVLPDPAHWEAFFEDYNNPVYIAWRRFRQASTDRFQRDVNAHFTGLGYKMLRPNYVCSCLLDNPSAYSFDHNKDLWTMIFQETFINIIIKQGWVYFACEAIHRSALANRTGVQSMTLFYPQSPDMLYFCQALTRLWGQGLLFTYLGNSEMIGEAQKYHAFDQKYDLSGNSGIRQEDFAVWFSESTRDYTEKARERYMNPFGHILQAAIVSGYSCGMVFEWDSIERLCMQSVIVMPSVAMISDVSLAKLKYYAANGGKLFILGAFAVWNDDGSTRERAEIEAFIKETSAVWLEEYCVDICQEPAYCNRKYENNPAPVPAPSNVIDLLREAADMLLKPCVSKCVEASNPDVLTGLFSVESGYLLHLFHMKDTIAQEGTLISHKQEAVNFVQGVLGIPGFEILIKRNGIKTAKLYTPEHDGEIVLTAFENASGTFVKIPDSAFAGYAVVKLEM